MAERRHRAPSRAGAPQARDKLAFLLALVPWLLEHDRVTVQEAAAHFGVTEEIVRSSVSLVAMSGVPGATATYQHEDLFDIDWDAFEQHDEIAITQHVALDEAPRLSAREAAALIAGLQYLQSLPENADRAAIRTLMEKLSRGASAAPSALAVAGGPDSEVIGLVRRAVADGHRVRFGYRNSRGELEARDVDPLRVESIDADWYLRGWCHLRQAPRTFRLDRMSDVAISDDLIEHTPEEVRLPDSLFEPSDEDLVVTIEAAPEVIGLLADYIPDGALTSEVGERIRTTLRVSHYHGLKRLIAGLPGTVRVVAPDQARRAVAEWAAAGLARYA